jgi:predicted dehydrogenase
MNIAIIGCGFVFDIYMRTLGAHPEIIIKGIFDINAARLEKAAGHYKLHAYGSFEDALADEHVAIIVNLTSISAHFDTSKRALLAGKHVYSEKPLTKNLEQSKELFAIQSRVGSRLICAPSNIYSDTVRTMLAAVRDGAIGKPVLVYAELDDNPIHLMGFDKVTSPSGARWPLNDEILEGCTFEHVGYHLVWICALLGPATSVTAFSTELLDKKSASLPAKVGTPDLSVACLTFSNGAAARITCSVVAPRDHRMRIIGDQGELSADSYRQYRGAVFLERFSKKTLSLRKLNFLRMHPDVGRLFGVGGKHLELARNWKSHAVEHDFQRHSSVKQRLIEWVRRKEVYAQDKFVGVAEMIREIEADQPQYLANDFLLHLNELTLMIQGAGPTGTAQKPTTTFSPLADVPGTRLPRSWPRNW